MGGTVAEGSCEALSKDRHRNTGGGGGNRLTRKERQEIRKVGQRSDALSIVSRDALGKARVLPGKEGSEKITGRNRKESGKGS